MFIKCLIVKNQCRCCDKVCLLSWTLLEKIGLTGSRSWCNRDIGERTCDVFPDQGVVATDGKERVLPISRSVYNSDVVVQT